MTEHKKKETRLGAFLKRKQIIITPRRYAIDAMSAMAQGLFASLLVGTILKAIGMIPGLQIFAELGAYAQAVSGASMGAAIAYGLNAPMLVTFSASAVGYAANALGGAGGPAAVLLIAIVAVECGKAISKETKVDIVVTPLVTVTVGGLLAVYIAPHIGTVVGYLSDFIGWATTQQPFVMGLFVSVIIGIALTLPISSAAICAGLGLSGMAQMAGGAVIDLNYEGLALAGGAAIAGCCAQMVGFAVMSFHENGVGGLISQGIGTSMLQMPNIVRNPRIWIPPIVASAITGPLATCVFAMQHYGTAINAGMGTCGALGPISMVLGWIGGEYPHSVGVMDYVGLLLICIVIPAAVSALLGALLRKIGWIREGDLRLD